MITVRFASVTFDPGQPRQWLLTEYDISKNLDRRMSRVQMGARFRVGRRSGKLLSSIRKRPGVSATGQYVDLLAGGAGVNYALAHHDGTRPHLIRARRRKALRFPTAGGVVFRRVVRHPGTQGTFYLTRSLPLAAAD